MGIGHRPVYKTLIWMVVLFFGLAFMAGCGSTGGTGDVDEEYELSYATWMAASSWWYQLDEEWMQRLNDKTDGRLNIVGYPGESLVNQMRIYDGILSGITNIGVTGCAYSPGSFPLMEILEMPGVKVNDTVSATFAKWETYKKFAPVDELSNVKVVYLVASAPLHLMTKDPIRSVDDIKGKKLRVNSNMDAKLIQALGGIPVEIPSSDVYLAMQRGALDGWWGPPTALDIFGLAEVANSITFLPFPSSGTLMWLMNQDDWNSLPADIQQIIDEDIEEEQLLAYAQATADAQNRGVEIAMESNPNFETVFLSDEETAKLQKVVDTLVEEWLDEAEAKGLPARDLWSEYVRQVEKYNELYPVEAEWWLEK